MSEPTPEQIKKALKEELRKQSRQRRGNTQGCGCLLLILSLILCVIIPPIGFILLLAGFVILLIGFLV